MSQSLYSYDVIQYDSYPYKQTHPNHLYTIGKLFGLKPTPYKQARILELGCAAGGNLIPMAYGAPESRCLGIDLSAKQIAEGQAVVEALRLKNIELRHQSILDFPPDQGLFDYIICHGLYTWVDSKTQEKILQICRAHLSEHGIAFISYNTLPGWNMVRSIRDMMRYHVQSFTEPREKAKQARAILQFINSGIQQQKTPYTQFLESEIQLLSKQSDNYLLHDHLEDQNNPIYFHEFVSQARHAELNYLADSEIAMMFPANLPQPVSQEICKITDIVRLGQYMDFVRNQRFRQTLLCHAEVTINRNLRTEQITDFYLKYEGSVEGDAHALTVDNAPLVFKGNLITLTLTRYLPKLAMWTLAKQPKPIHYHAFVDLICAQAKISDKQQIERILNEELNLLRLALGGLVALSSAPASFAQQPTQTPKTTALVQEQLRTSNLVTNLCHEVVRLNPLEKQLLKLCNGTLNQQAVGKQLAQNIIKEQISIYKEDGTVIVDPSEIVRRCEYLAGDLLKSFAKNALLVDA